MIAKKKDSAEKTIRDIRRATLRRYSAEEKIRIVPQGRHQPEPVLPLVEGVSGGRPHDSREPGSP